MRSLALGLAILACLALPASAAETLEIRSRPIPTMPAARPASELLHAFLTRPAGAAPAPALTPAIIVLHGCGGLGRGMDRWLTRLTSWGYAAAASA